MAAQSRLQYSEATQTTPALTTAYAAIVTLDCRDYDTITLLLKNTSTAHSLKYKISSRAYATSGSLYEESSEATLTSATMAQKTYTKKLAQLVVYAKSSTTSIPTYQLDHIRGL